MSSFFPGQILSLPYRDGLMMRVIVIDPDGQGEGRPTLGMGFGMTEENLGLPKSTLSRWTLDSVANNECNTLEALSDNDLVPLQDSECNTPTKLLKSPSGNSYRVLQIPDETGNTQLVIEGCDWVDLACDVSDSPGKVKKATVDKLNSFVRWLAKKGFYSTVYAQILGSYERADDNKLNEHIDKLKQENQSLKEQLEEFSNELALAEYRNDRQNYLVDELQRDMSWHRTNSWGGRDK